MMIFAFIAGSIATLLGSWLTRRAYTAEPLFPKEIEIEPEPEEEEEEPETEAERLRREDAEFKEFRGFL